MRRGEYTMIFNIDTGKVMHVLNNKPKFTYKMMAYVSLVIVQE